MKLAKRLFAILMTVCMIVCVFAACGAQTGDDAPSGADAAATSIKVWVPSEEAEITETMVQSFKDNTPEYADANIEVVVMGVDESIAALKQDADAAADVFLYPSSGIAEMDAAGLIYPITLGVDEVKANHGEGAVESCSYNGELYGVPVTPNGWFMFYNKSMYTEDEVLSLETMMAKDLGEGVANFSCNIDDSWYMCAFFYAAGCTLFGEDGTDPDSCSWNDATGYKVGEYLINLVNNDKYVEDADGLAGALIGEGKLGALCSGTWSAESISTALGENYAATKLPTINIDGVDCQMSNFGDIKAFGVKSSTEQPKLAMALAVWLGNEECQLLRFETNATPPTITSLMSNPTVMADPAACALGLQSACVTPAPTTAQYSEYWVSAAAFGAGVVNGDITVDNLQASLDAMVEGITTKIAE